VIDPVARAKSYPFRIPARSYLFVDGRDEPWDGHQVDSAARVPVLAAGSNQSPEQLARKYAPPHADGMIPAQRGVLRDFDVVYAAKFAGYGSVPATFQAAPGIAVTVFVLWLTPSQLARMHATEAGYSYDRLIGIRVELDGGGALDTAYAYCSRFGCLNLGGPASLAEIGAVGRRSLTLSQAEVQERVRALLAPELALDAFIASNVADASLRAERAARLAANALPLAFARETLLLF
jgi:hypothetical protein